jgi:hypothetical protein
MDYGGAFGERPFWELRWQRVFKRPVIHPKSTEWWNRATPARVPGVTSPVAEPLMGNLTITSSVRDLPTIEMRVGGITARLAVFDRSQWMDASGQPIEINELTKRQRRGVCRVSAVVADYPVWFESADADLSPSWEAFASAFLVPALHLRRPIKIAGPVDGCWRENIESICQRMHEWWGCSSTAQITSKGLAELPPPKAEIGQFFSGGVDSFYSLLRGKHPSRHLVFVHGFDIPHYDMIRFRGALRSLREVADQAHRSLIVVRTNLRRHPLYNSSMASWERTHGGALAATGHLLSSVLGGVVVPSSYDAVDNVPCGSHQDLDPQWSTSNFRLIHDEPIYRLRKLKQIAAEPILRRNLRVCWENLSIQGNCSRCGKCVRTMLVLLAADQLRHFQAFDQRIPLTKILEGPVIEAESTRKRYQEILADGLPEDVANAVRRLLERKTITRNEPVQSVIRRFRNALLRICP